MSNIHSLVTPTSATVTPFTCRHCRRQHATRRRRLCKTCYHNPSIRRLYPPDKRQCDADDYFVSAEASGEQVKLCRHCNRKKANRPRGLCFSCYYKPGVIDLYPVTSKYAPKKLRDGGEENGVIAQSCAPGEIPCLACGVPVKVGSEHAEARVRLRLNFTICQACESKCQ
jgi:hypothetical protein